MKASEFIKRFGVDDAGEYLCGASFWEIDGKPIAPCVDDLKRIVASYELVMDYYGLTRAKEHAESNYTAPELKDALKQAIADVESCQ